MIPPYTPAQWATIQKNAAARLATDPENPKWLKALHDSYAALRQPEPTATPDTPGALASAGLGAAEGVSSGLASRIGDLLPGPKNTEVLSQARAAHPYATAGGDLVGSAVQAALLSRLPGIRALGPAGQGFVTGGTTGAMRGGVEGGPVAALLGGGLGALGGYGVGKVAQWTAPAARAVVNDIRGVLGKTKAPDTAIRTALTKAGVAPDFLDAAVAAAKKAQVLPVRGTVDASLETPTAIRRGTVVQSPVDQRYAQPEGILPYYSRGGAVEQAAPPPPVQSPTGLLGTQTLDRTDPQAVAAWLKDQIALAESFGQHITPAKLSKLLAGFDPKIITQVTKLVR